MGKTSMAYESSKHFLLHDVCQRVCIIVWEANNTYLVNEQRKFNLRYADIDY